MKVTIGRNVHFFDEQGRGPFHANVIRIDDDAKEGAEVVTLVVTKPAHIDRHDLDKDYNGHQAGVSQVSQVPYSLDAIKGTWSWCWPPKV